MTGVTMKRAGLCFALLLATGPAVAGKVELRFPRRSPWLSLQAEQELTKAKDDLKGFRDLKAKGGANEYDVEMFEKLVQEKQEQAEKVKKILRRSKIDFSSIEKRFEETAIVLHIPGRVTVVEGLTDSGMRGNLFFYAPDGKLLWTMPFPEEHADVKLADGWGDGWSGLAGRAGIDWFPIDKKGGSIGMVVRYPLGDLGAQLPMAFWLARPVVLTPKGKVIPGPFVLYGAQDVYDEEFAERLNPIAGCIFIGDVNGDGFQDLVLWKKRYRIPPSLDPDVRWQAWHTGKPWNPKGCIKVEQSVVVMLFSPAKGRFLDPKPAPELLPMPEKLWQEAASQRLLDYMGIYEIFECSDLCQGCKH